MIKQQILSSGHYVVFNDALISAPAGQHFKPEYWAQRQQILGHAKGRGTTLFIQHDDAQWVLRHYRRGGLIGKLVKDHYLYTGLENTRAFMEFRLLQTMRDKGLRVPTPVAAQVVKDKLRYRADLITVMIPGSEDLHSILCKREITDAQWQKVGCAIAQLHGAQVYHHDLNIRNIMLDQACQVWIIDFDRCYQRSGSGWKKENLARLHRSLEKEATRNNPFYYSAIAWQNIMKGYQA